MNIGNANKVALAAVVLVVASALAATSACTFVSRTGPLQTESETVELDGAESVRVDLRMGAGELLVEGGADALMEGEFTYNVEEWQPIVEYSVSGDEGELSVRQPEAQNIGIGEYRYEWDLRFAEDVPLDMSVRLGAGRSTLDVAELSLTGLSIEAGAGQTTVDLNRDWEQDLEVSMRGGVGQATIYLPDDVGVRAEVDGGVGQLNTPGLMEEDGAYVNDAYGETDATLTLDIEGGVGQITLEVVE